MTVKEMEGGLKVFPLVQSLFPTLLVQEAPPQTFWKHANNLIVLVSISYFKAKLWEEFILSVLHYCEIIDCYIR